MLNCAHTAFNFIGFTARMYTLNAHAGFGCVPYDVIHIAKMTLNTSRAAWVNDVPRIDFPFGPVFSKAGGPIPTGGAITSQPGREGTFFNAEKYG